MSPTGKTTLSHKVIEASQRNAAGATIRTDAAPTRQTKKLGEGRGRPALLTVPIVLVGTLAISLNLAAPAEAHVPAKKPLKSKLAEAAVATAVAPVRVAAQTAPVQYTVVSGDTVSGIGARFGVATSTVLALNGLDSYALIFPGQVITLNSAAAPAPASTGPVPASTESYTVKQGDTVSAIASAHGVATANVLTNNGLTARSVIFPGQVLALSAMPTTEAAVHISPLQSSAAAATHTITTGDTITAVALSAGVSVQAVLDANGLGWSSIIYPGQILTLPGSNPIASAGVVATPGAVPGVVTPLSDEMRHNAHIIVSVGRSAGVSDAGLVIGLAAAAQESGLRNVNFGDRDSLGLFQQRPSAGWGTPEQVMDPSRASSAFFGGAGNPNSGVTRGLLDIAGWQSMTLTQAAQAVQISAYPDYYAKWQTSAEAWLVQIG